MFPPTSGRFLGKTQKKSAATTRIGLSDGYVITTGHLLPAAGSSVSLCLNIALATTDDNAIGRKAMDKHDKPTWLEKVWMEVADEIAYEEAHPQPYIDPADCSCSGDVPCHRCGAHIGCPCHR